MIGRKLMRDKEDRITKTPDNKMVNQDALIEPRLVSPSNHGECYHSIDRASVIGA